MWLAKLTENGLLRPSFGPPQPIRQLRDYTRLRIDLTRERTRYWQRLEKLLEDALIKVSSVAFQSGYPVRDMLEALIAGERDPRRLAGLARRAMKAKHTALVEALTGRFDDHHAELARMLLDQIDTLNAQIARLTTRIDDLLVTIIDEHSYPVPSDGHDAAPRRVCTHCDRAARRNSRRRAWRRADHSRRSRTGHNRFSHGRAPGVVGETVPAHHPVRADPARRSNRQGQSLSQGSARRGRSRSRQAKLRLPPWSGHP